MAADVRRDRYTAVRIEGRFRAALNANDWSNVSRLACQRRIPHKERLAVRIVRVDLDAPAIAGKVPNLRGKSFPKRPGHPDTTGIPDCIKLCSALFSGQLLHLLDGRCLIKIAAKDRDID